MCSLPGAILKVLNVLTMYSLQHYKVSIIFILFYTDNKTDREHE